ncbi:anaphase-promoting complex subunit 10 isoform X2 [Aedes albopictus]|uniref:Anaphase-promoting complex subunit 10 n=1 Tax=Aedes albopictus TaxID=7160 RepID=A0ABM1Z9Z7_AEDAL|nr:anaphase-promoting complex subunit 10-like isoform X2 [Aedes albopictus]XP_019565508.2 anaphase-promoting complex subunit 10 isoform X2 [Aedes albopictus]
MALFIESLLPRYKMNKKTGVTVCPTTEERSGTVREVGSQAIWSLSSCKPGFGVEQLRDNSMETYWQSDGQLPHLVNIQFSRKTTVSQIYIYSDYKLDESYTPSRVSIRCGTHFNDLQEVEVLDLCEPSGWVCIPIKEVRDIPMRTFMIQIAVISNHQNGRDTHMRQIRVHSPTDLTTYPLEQFGPFSTIEFQQFRTIR